MLQNIRTLVWASALVVSSAACEERPKPAAETKPAPTTAPAAAMAPAAQPASAPAKPSRPSKIDPTLTDARRSKIEAAVGEAQGFLSAVDLEHKLVAKKVKDEKAALAAFDALAKNQWVLFTGPITNAKDGNFDLGITYTQRAENDPMGMSRQFFLVTFSDIKGYDEKKLEGGQMAIVLAKYTGARKASPGQELIENNLW